MLDPMLLALVLLANAPTPTPAPKAKYVVILRDDATRYTASEDPRGKRLVVLTGPDGRKTSATSADIDSEATRLANLPRATNVDGGPVTLGNAPPTPRSVTEMSKEQKAKGEKGSVSVGPGGPLLARAPSATAVPSPSPSPKR